MRAKVYILRFRAVNRDIFNAVKKGKKKVETRAATEKYRYVKVGDTVRLVCGKQKFEKTVRKVRVFKTISAMLRRYKAKRINPSVKDEMALRKMYDSFPGYKVKIKKHGLIAFELR